MGSKQKLVSLMLDACSSGSKESILELLSSEEGKNALFNPACQQDELTGQSPLMTAAKAGHTEVCRLLLEHGAPWNALDRKGKCAGNYASDEGHQDVVDLLVDAGVKAELILGTSQRLNKSPDEHGTKPDYLSSHKVRYNVEETTLLDEDNDAIMMEWERPLMKAHASIITNNNSPNLKVLNVGFGMGIIDTILQETKPALHIIIEAHPDVHANMISQGWDKKNNVRICFGKWQDVVPNLINEGITLDGIFFDTYGEHFLDLEDFHTLMCKLLAKPNGIYSFFNGLAPDNIFFHGVACQCVKLQLGKLGLDTDFAACEIKVNEKEWSGVRRKYWHNDTYYLPISTWNKDYLSNINEEKIQKRKAKKTKVNEPINT